MTCCYERHYATNGDFQDFCPPCQDAAQTHKAKLEAFEKQYKDKWPSSLQPKERGNPKPATRAMWDLIKQMQIHCTYQEKKEKRRTSQPKPYEPSEQVSQGRRHSIGGGDHETREAVYMNALEVPYLSYLSYLSILSILSILSTLSYLLACLYRFIRGCSRLGKCIVHIHCVACHILSPLAYGLHHRRMVGSLKSQPVVD